MARVIEILKTEEKIVVHKDCGAKVGYYKNEEKNYTYTDYGGGSNVVYYITCPNCGEKIILREV
jgi:predicted RNA-binding Zn-ribbon protein involved in translation (DUF1610 family)